MKSEIREKDGSYFYDVEFTVAGIPCNDLAVESFKKTISEAMAKTIDDRMYAEVFGDFKYQRDHTKMKQIMRSLGT